MTRRCRSAAETQRATCRPPHGRAGASVDEVDAEEERELVAQQPMVGAELPQRPGLALRCEQSVAGDDRVEQHEPRSTCEPVDTEGVHAGAQPVGIVERVGSDPVERDVVPSGERPVAVSAGRRIVHEEPPTEERARPVRPSGREVAQPAGSAS